MKSPIQLGKPPYPIQHDEDEKAAKIETKTIDQSKVMYQLTGKIRFKEANASITAQGM